MRFGLVGPTYTSSSPKFANERAINVYCEPIESPNPGKGGSKMMLQKIPGLKLTHTLPDRPLKCLFSGDGLRVFAVSGTTLFELFTDGTFATLGSVGTGPGPVQMAANGNQLFIVAGGKGYLANGIDVTSVVDNVCLCEYLDEYFIAVEGAIPGNAKRFRISNPLNGAIWDALDFNNAVDSPDNIVAMIVDHRQVIFLKQQHGEFYVNNGDPNFPINPVLGTFVEQGCIAAASFVRIDNTVMWLGGDERGAGIVWRMQGTSPSRVSNYAVESAIQEYTRQGLTITDAVAFAYQDGGHTFYVLSFPAANATWVYDCSTGLWHERAHWDTVNAQWTAHWARYHCYAFGKHLVGGGDDTGKVYEQSLNYQDDAGTPLRWLRQAPHIATPGGFRTFFGNLFVDMQVGVGVNTLVDGDGIPRMPVVMVRHSNDGGYTWNPEQQLPIGKIGQYSIRARQIFCGSGRDRNVEISGSDPVITAIIEGDMDASAGTS